MPVLALSVEATGLRVRRLGSHLGCAATRSAACAPKEVTAVIAALALAGCASKSADVAPAYVSPLQYQSFTCPQLTAEAQRVAAAAATAAGQQDAKRQGCRGNHRGCAHRLARAISDPRRQAKRRSASATER